MLWNYTRLLIHYMLDHPPILRRIDCKKSEICFISEIKNKQLSIKNFFKNPTLTIQEKPIFFFVNI